MASETPGKRRSKDKSFPPAKSAKMDVMTQHNDDSTVNGESSYAQSQHITLHQLQGPEPAATSLIITPEDAERAVSTVKCEMTGDARDERNELDEPDLVEFDASEEIIVPKTKLCFIGWSETVSCCVLRLRNTMHHVAILRPEFVGDCTQHKECFKTMKDFKVKILESIRFAVNKGDVIFVDNTPSPHVLVKEPYMSTILPLLKKGKKVVDLTVYEDIGDADKAALEVQKTGASYLRLRILGFLDEKRFGTASAIAGGCDEIYEDIGSVLAVMCRKWRKFESSREATGYAAINQSMKGMQAAVLSEGQQVFSRALDKYNDDQNENDPPQSIFHRMLTDNLVSSKILGTREMNTAVEESRQQLLPNSNYRPPQQPINIVLKDMKCVESVAENFSSSTCMLGAAKKVLFKSLRAGLDDLGQVSKSYKQLCKCKSPQEDEDD